MRTWFYILVFIVVGNTCVAQPGLIMSSNKDFLHRKGDYYFERYNYRKAIIYYKKSAKSDITDNYALLRLAESYALLELQKQAEVYYRMAIEGNMEVSNEYILKYALILLANEKFEESKRWLTIYNQRVEEDLRGDNYLQSIENREKFYKDSIIMVVDNIEEINTDASEINPVPFSNELLITSSRRTSVDDLNNRFYDIFLARVSLDGKRVKVIPFNTSINSNYHEGPLAVSSDKSSLFFTRNIAEENNKSKVNLGIFEIKIPKEPKEELEVHHVSIREFDYSMGHPAINHDATELYFISDAPKGGIGGVDIYRSKLVNNEWSYPENLGNRINTKGDEMFPFLLNDSILYFASNGHGGLGGLDIFRVNVMKQPLEVTNLGYPVNSAFDDFGLYITEDGKTGYLSSNRPGGLGGDDIYKVEFLNFKIKGSLIDAESKELVEDAKISLLFGNGKEKQVSLAEDGKFEFSITPGESYTLVIEKENYAEEEIHFNNNITYELREDFMIQLEPLQKTEIQLYPGQKYTFTTGNDSSKLVDEYARFENVFSPLHKLGDSIPEVIFLDRQMNFLPGDIYSMMLVKNKTATPLFSFTGETVMMINTDMISLTEDSLLFILPVEEKSRLKMQSDLDYIADSVESGNYSFAIDDKPILSEEDYKTFPEEEEALRELERLMEMNIYTTPVPGEETGSRDITAKGFEIIPGQPYTLLVGKKNIFGLDERMLEIPLTSGVKYNFGSNPEAIANNEYQLLQLLKSREGIIVTEGTAIDISLLSKELEIGEGEEFSISLLPDSTQPDTSDEGTPTTIILADETIHMNDDEKLTIKVPYSADQKVNVQTDITYLEENFSAEEYTVDIDTIPFFSEIVVDTTGYHLRYLEEEDIWLLADQEEAVRELERLMEMNIYTTPVPGEETGIRDITAKGFEIIPGQPYTLLVGKKNSFGLDEKMLEIPLTSGVKYNFGSNPEAIANNEYQLLQLLKSREGIIVTEGTAIDISLLSKELEIGEGEEFSISLLPDSTQPDTSDEGTPTTIILADETIHMNDDEKLTIKVPYSADQKVNVQTDITYLEENFNAEEYNVDIDTIPFFSEIVVDTTGYYLRYREEEDVRLLADQEEAVRELERLMEMNIYTTPVPGEETGIRDITAKGFEIIPGQPYALLVGKKNSFGLDEKMLEIPLTSGVKYNFGSNPEAIANNEYQLLQLLKSREGIIVTEGTAIDISLLSKELEIGEGEEFSISLLPDSTQPDTSDEGTPTTIILADETIHMNDDEKLTIKVPYSADQKVNVQTDITYLEENFSAEEYTVDIDTIPFFSEIVVDTTGYYLRYRDPVLTGSESRLVLVYRVQVAASRKPIPDVRLHKIYTGKQGVSMFREEGWFKYYIAEAPTYFEAKQILNHCGVDDAFIAAYQDDEKLTLKEAMTKQYEERMERSGMSVTDSVMNIVTVNFEFNEYSLRNDDKQYLQNLVIDELMKYPEYYVTINGHTDIRGDMAYNYALSDQRAEFVKGILVNEGIDAQRIRTFSFGETQVLKACEVPDECDESVHKVNRRVEIILFSPAQ